MKKCLECRVSSKKWRDENKERVKQYNKMYNDNRHNNRKRFIILAKKQSTNEWIRFDSLSDAARQLQLHTANICKVLHGTLSQTGGYIFKKEENDRDILEVSTWEQIKHEHNFEHKQLGKPSRHRIAHEEIDSEIGKVCCSCKVWRVLSKYNFSKSHWDNLRNDCKLCLSDYRKKNRHRLNDTHKQYIKERKTKDPLFKLRLSIRSRISHALKSQNIVKQNTTNEYLGCSVPFFKRYIEVQFVKDMNWDNHGKLWDIDHIIPITYEKPEKHHEIISRFHWSNCQPMWHNYNVSKNNRYISFGDNCALTKNEYIALNLYRLLIILGRIGLCIFCESLRSR